MVTLNDLPPELRRSIVTHLLPIHERAYGCPTPMPRSSYSCLCALALTSRIWRLPACSAMWHKVALFTEDQARRSLASPLQDKRWSTRRLDITGTAFLALHPVLLLVNGVQDLTLRDDGTRTSPALGRPYTVDLRVLSLRSLRSMHSLPRSPFSADLPCIYSNSHPRAGGVFTNTCRLGLPLRPHTPYSPRTK